MNNLYENEIWKQVKGYEDRYCVSNYGRVWSLYKDKELSLYETNGYLYCSLWKDWELKNVAMHRLVAETFLQPDIDDLVVHHIDENKKNNYVDNLCIMTKSAHMQMHKLGKPGSRHRGVRVYDGETGDFIKEFDSQIAAAKFVYNDENLPYNKSGAISRAIKCGYQVNGYRFSDINVSYCVDTNGCPIRNFEK